MVAAFLSHIHEILRRNSETKSLVRLLMRTSVKTKFSRTHSVWMKAQLAFSVALTAGITNESRVRFFPEEYKPACFKKNPQQTLDQQRTP